MPKSRLLAWSFASVVALLLAACGVKNADQTADEVAFDSVRLTAYSGATAVGMTHEVRDYNSWLKAYSELSDPESRLSIFASPEDPNLITVFELTKSHNEAKSIYTSTRFKKTLDAEGVTTNPILSFFDVKFRESSPTDKIYRLGVSHEVQDYDNWKKIFDEDNHIRVKANLELRAISTSADNPLMVNILFATDDIERAKEVINSDELKKRMTEAGVKTEPSFAVFRVPEATPR